MTGLLFRLIEQIESELHSEIDLASLVSTEETNKTMFSGRSPYLLIYRSPCASAFKIVPSEPLF